MIVTILDQKYKCNCGKGMINLQEEGVLSKLNSVIEWDKCSWPKKLKDGVGQKEKYEDSDFEEVKDFLGAVPELKPGNCFFYEGSVIAVNSKDELVLVVSETGWGMLSRFYNEILTFEYDMKFTYSTNVNNVSIELVEKPENEDEKLKVYRIPYYRAKIFSERFISGRYEKNYCLKITLDSNNLLFPLSVFVSEWEVLYDPEFIFEDEQIELMTNEIISYLCINNVRL